MRYLLVVLLFGLSISIKGQDVISKVTLSSCECISKLPYDSSSIIPTDSIIKCVVVGMMRNFQELMANKKMKMGTVEGIRALRNKVINNLKKDCPKMKNAAIKIESK